MSNDDVKLGYRTCMFGGNNCYLESSQNKGHLFGKKDCCNCNASEVVKLQEINNCRLCCLIFVENLTILRTGKKFV